MGEIIDKLYSRRFYETIWFLDKNSKFSLKGKQEIYLDPFDLSIGGKGINLIFTPTEEKTDFLLRFEYVRPWAPEFRAIVYQV